MTIIDAQDGYEATLKCVASSLLWDKCLDTGLTIPGSGPA